jgi:shikimate kinase
VTGPHIALVGMPGAGKSTVARRLAARLGRGAVDLDDEIVADAGRDVATIFAEEGEGGFRRRETTTLRTVLGSDDPGLVVACGGGVVLADENRELLAARATTVWLQASLDVLAVRLGGGATRRPLLDGDDRDAGERLAALDAARRDLYDSVADLRVDAGELSADEVVDRIAAGLEALAGRAARA